MAVRAHVMSYRRQDALVCTRAPTCLWLRAHGMRRPNLNGCLRAHVASRRDEHMQDKEQMPLGRNHAR